jgi:lysozyme
MSEVHLIDVYHGDGTVDWHKVAAAGHVGALAKASEGTGSLDANLKTNLAGMKAAGLIRGAYHFFHVSQDPVQQAAHFINALRNADFDFDNDLPPCLDLEDRPGAEAAGKAKVIQCVASFLEHIEQETKRRCIIYVDRDYAETYVGDSFAGHPLWLASFTSATTPHLPSGWKNWVLWQYAENGTVPGVPNPNQTDLNRFNGTVEQLKTWATTGTFPG